MEPKEISDLIKKYSDASDVFHVTTFKGYRNNRELTVEIWDSGPASQLSGRYHIVARDEDGGVATGNPKDDINEALVGVHWFELDKAR